MRGEWEMSCLVQVVAVVENPMLHFATIILVVCALVAMLALARLITGYFANR